MTVEFNAGGDLVFSAQDLGPLVQELLGHDEYEFWYTVPSAWLAPFAELAGLEAADPIRGLVANWAGDERFGQLQALMRSTNYVRFTSY